MGLGYNRVRAIMGSPALFRYRLRKKDDCLWVFSSFHLRGPSTHNLSVKNFNNKIKLECIGFLLDKLQFDSPVIITDLPGSLSYLDNIPKRLLCYDCLDNYSSFSWAGPAVDAGERELAKRSHIITATSRSLFDKMKKINPSTFLLPNAVDFDHFSQSREILLENDRPPVIGFVGAFYEWVDQELLLFLAGSRPEWQFVIIGPKQPGLPNSLRHVDNITFLGAVNYHELPPYMAGFDVCIIPFKVNSTTDSVNPIKMWEYMAAGKPVVSTPIPEAKRLKDVIYIGNGREHFLNQVEKALAKKDHWRISRGITRAGENDWNHRVQTLTRLIHDALAARQVPPP